MSVKISTWIIYVLLFLGLYPITPSSGRCLDDQKSLLLSLRNGLGFDSKLSTTLLSWNRSKDCCRWAGVYCDEAHHVTGIFLNNDHISGKVYLDVFGKFKYLQDLDLADNNVTVIPNTKGSSFSSLANLTRLLLASCKMSEIPDLRNIPNLRTLDLSGNLLKGEIPIWMWNLGNGSLVSLKLSQNKFSSLQKPYRFPFTLSVLDLSSNKLKGDIPVPPTEIYLLNYSNNEFGSSIPAEFGNALPYAYSFSISNGKVVGVIPESINKAEFLRVLDLSNNALTGPIPVDGSMQYLETLDLSLNKLSGRIPEQLTSIMGLEFLNVSYNRLFGKIPQGGVLQYPTFTNMSFEGNKGLCGPPLSKTCGTSNNRI